MTVKKNIKKGGSIASDRVNSLVKPCEQTKSPNLDQHIPKKILADNYGAIYKTTGGFKFKNNKNKSKKKISKRKGGSIASDRVNSLVKPCQHNTNTKLHQDIPKNFLANNYGVIYKTTGGNRKKYKKKTNKKGGSRVLGGDTVPNNILQKITNSFQGKPTKSIDFTKLGSITGATVGLDLGSRGYSDINDASNVISNSYSSPWDTTISVDGVTPDIPNKIMDQYGQNPLKRAGYLQAGGSKKKNRKGGGSSDWRSSVYSRGPVNYPGQDTRIFNQFSDSRNYISNSELAKGLANGFKPSQLIKTSLLKPDTNPPFGFNINGVSSKSFSGGRRKKSNNKKI